MTDAEYDFPHEMEMKIGGMIIYFAIFVSGIVLLIFYCKKFKHYDSPKGDMFNQINIEEEDKNFLEQKN